MNTKQNNFTNMGKQYLESAKTTGETRFFEIISIFQNNLFINFDISDITEKVQTWICNTYSGKLYVYFYSMHVHKFINCNCFTASIVEIPFDYIIKRSFVDLYMHV